MKVETYANCSLSLCLIVVQSQVVSYNVVQKDLNQVSNYNITVVRSIIRKIEQHYEWGNIKYNN